MSAAEQGERLSERNTRTPGRRWRGAASLRREPRPPGSALAVLLLIAGNVNYFYDRFGQRMAEAFANLGVDAQVATLRNFPRGSSIAASWSARARSSPVTATAPTP